MSFEHGTLIQWNDERGFGFIKPDLENAQVFVHIKSFGPIARRPAIGDRVWFDSMIGEQGKRKATIARITEPSTTGETKPIRSDPLAKRQGPSNRRPVARDPSGPTGWSPKQRRSGGYHGIRRRTKSFLLASLIPVLGISWISSRCSSAAPSSPLRSTPAQSAPAQGISFQCAGKEHCSQMSSKEEAQFYLAHCPNVKVDGDGDGDACEGQFGH